MPESPVPHAEVLFKIIDAAEWTRAGETYSGSADDLRDGFIHLSTREQVSGTLERHFAGQRDLLLLEIDAASVAAQLRWEASRGGALFPHLYAPLPRSAVRAETKIA